MKLYSFKIQIIIYFEVKKRKKRKQQLMTQTFGSFQDCLSNFYCFFFHSLQARIKENA